MTSLIIVYHSGLEALRSCLASVSAGTTTPDQVVLVNNSGTSVLGVLPHYHYPLDELEVANDGYASGVNVGVRYVQRHYPSTQYLWLLNPDTEVAVTTLTLLVQTLRNNESLAAISPTIYDITGQVWYAGGYYSKLRNKTVHKTTLSRAAHSDYWPTPFITFCAPLIRMSAWKAVGALDERYFLYYEDADWSLRASGMGETLAVSTSATIVHHEASRSNPKKTYHLVRSGVAMLREYPPFGTSILASATIALRTVYQQAKVFVGLGDRSVLTALRGESLPTQGV